MKYVCMKLVQFYHQGISSYTLEYASIRFQLFMG